MTVNVENDNNNAFVSDDQLTTVDTSGLINGLANSLNCLKDTQEYVVAMQGRESSQGAGGARLFQGDDSAIDTFKNSLQSGLSEVDGIISAIRDKQNGISNDDVGPEGADQAEGPAQAT